MKLLDKIKSKFSKGETITIDTDRVLEWEDKDGKYKIGYSQKEQKIRNKLLKQIKIIGIVGVVAIVALVIFAGVIVFSGAFSEAGRLYFRR